MSITTDATSVDNAMITLENNLTTLRTTCRTTEAFGARAPAGPLHVLPSLEFTLACRIARLLPGFFTPPGGTTDTCASIAQKVTGA